MICGLKWKTCNCPWFSYEAVENDRRNYLNFPPAGRAPEDAGRNLLPVDIGRHRAQEWLDEAYARRLVLGDHNAEDFYVGGGQEDVLNVGNAAGHFLNQDFVPRETPLPGRNIGQATAAAATVIAEHRRRTGAPNADLGRGQRLHPLLPVRIRLGRSEGVIPRRTATDYMSEAARHRPSIQNEAVERPHLQMGRRRQSTMAGLAGNTQAGRVGTWLDHVDDDPLDMRPGVPIW